MKKLFIIAIAACLTASPSFSACFVHYKAKQENPLKLHYGVLKLKNAQCQSNAALGDIVSSRLLPNGWSLLNIVTVSSMTPTQQQQENAGEFFLRY